MAENTTYEAAQKVTTSFYEANQAIMQSAVAAQERNARFVQAVFDNGVEVLKSHVAATQNLLQTVSNQAQNTNTEEVVRTVRESAIAAQGRNAALAQSILEDGTRVAQSHVAATQELGQTLMEKAHTQQEAVATLPYVQASIDLFYAPLSYYKRAMETTQVLTNQAAEMVEVAQKTALQGMEVGQKMTQQAMEAVLSATRKEQ